LTNNEKAYIDSVIWIGALDSNDRQHKLSNKIIRQLLRKATADSLFLSDYVFAEILNTITNKQKYQNYSKTKRKNFVKKVQESIYDSRYVKILKVSELHLGTAFNFMVTRPDLFASLTDWLSLILMIENKISIIATLDSDFKKLVNTLPEFNHIALLDS
jgi:predicted nucleic acid-binding protein